MRRNSRRSSPGAVMVRGPTAGSPVASTDCTTASGENASSALPTPAACAGSRPPTSDGIRGASRLRTISTYITSVPTSTARCTVCLLTCRRSAM